MASLFHKFFNIAKSLSFADFGAAKAEKLSEIEPFFKKYLENGFCAEMGYLRRNVEKRLDPTLLMEEAKSVLCFLVPYTDSSMDLETSPIAGYALGEDYHTVIKERLHMFAKEAGLTKYRAFVDTAPVFERQWAARCGLGFIGCNNFLISPEYGLHTLIGVILCDISFENIDCEELALKKSKMPKDCGACGNCIRSCPTGALCAPYTLDANKCIAYLTVESPERKDGSVIELYGMIFGCEKCLLPCPWNKQVNGWKEFSDCGRKTPPSRWKR